MHFVMAALVFSSLALSVRGSAETTPSLLYCERLLSSIHGKLEGEALLDKLDELEAAILSVESETPGLELSQVRTEFEAATDHALSGRYDLAFAGIERALSALMSQFRRKTAVEDQAEALRLEQLITAPNEVIANVRYQTIHAHLQVEFSPTAIDAFVEIDSAIIVKLLRSIQKGFVSAHSGPGIYRATDVHKEFVEVKYLGRGAERLIGCLKGGVLSVKKVISKRNEGTGGSLAAFKGLCS